MQRFAKSQAGLAILTVLLIIALMVTLLGFLVEQQHLLIRRLANQGVSEQGYHYAAGVDAWAARLLHEDENRVIDYWGEDWAAFGEPPEVEADGQESFSLDLSSQRDEDELPQIDFGNDVDLSFQIEDLSARYNLNNLATKDETVRALQRTIFVHLLEQLGIGELDERQQLYGALVDWLDEGDGRGEYGFESSDYRSKRTPYHAADQMLTSLGELRFVRGFDEDIINTLSPYVTALPVTNARLNINTASVEVLSSLSTHPVFDTSSVSNFLEIRNEDEFLGFAPAQIEAAQTAIIGVSPQGSTFIPNMLQTKSNFFQVTSRVMVGDYLFCSKTLLFRENPDDQSGTAPKVTVLSREHNTICDEIVH